MISVENVGLYQNDIGVMYSNPLRRVDDRGDNPGSRGTKCVTLTLLAMLCSLACVFFYVELQGAEKEPVTSRVLQNATIFAIASYFKWAVISIYKMTNKITSLSKLEKASKCIPMLVHIFVVIVLIATPVCFDCSRLPTKHRSDPLPLPEKVEKCFIVSKENSKKFTRDSCLSGVEAPFAVSSPLFDNFKLRISIENLDYWSKDIVREIVQQLQRLLDEKVNDQEPDCFRFINELMCRAIFRPCSNTCRAAKLCSNACSLFDKKCDLGSDPVSVNKKLIAEIKNIALQLFDPKLKTYFVDRLKLDKNNQTIFGLQREAIKSALMAGFDYIDQVVTGNCNQMDFLQKGHQEKFPCWNLSSVCGRRDRGTFKVSPKCWSGKEAASAENQGNCSFGTVANDFSEPSAKTPITHRSVIINAFLLSLQVAETLKLSKFECPVQTSPIRVLPQFHRSSVLEVLMISNLSVTGKLVKNYDYLKRLKKLTLSQNRLVGEIPNWNFINISYIDLSNNDLNGTVPSSIFTASLDVLKASVNPGLAGQLPKLPKNMTCIDMRWTNISSLQFPAEYIEKVKVLLLPWPNFQGFSPHCKTVDATDVEHKKFRLRQTFRTKVCAMFERRQ